MAGGRANNMLHEVRTAELKVGMYVKSMDCSWLASPFWRRQFKIGSTDDIDDLSRSGVTMVTIDDSKGVGPGPDEESMSSDQPFLRVAADPTPRLPSRPTLRRKRIAAPSEVDRARATVERSRLAVTAMFNEARLGHAVQIAIIGPMVDDIAASVARDASAMLKVTRLKSKNEYTYLHSVAVCALMINLARRLDLSEEEARRIGMAGLLHDIGKMAVPDTILDKPGTLDDAEWRAIRNHPEAGHRLLSGSANIDALALDVCLHHHERIDGRGYPYGKKAEQISIYARMGAICDVYDALTSNRPYKTSWSPNEALAKMLEWEGHFDPDILDAFIDSIGIPPVNSLVRLQSNRLALVTDGNDDDPTAPPVRAFYSIPDQVMLPLEDVVTGGKRAVDPIIQMERGDYWFGSSWPEVRDSLADNRAPVSSDFIPARPYVDLGHNRGSSIRSVVDAIMRDRQGQRR